MRERDAMLKEGEAGSAVVLLSGGLDSATCLAAARAEGLECHALAVDYGQRHRVELESARVVAGALGARSFKVVRIDLRAIGGSALTGEMDVPKGDKGGEREEGGASEMRVPVTYVPARNLVFLSVAAGYAEVIGAGSIYIGVNAVDYSGYPDCRPQFIRAFEEVVRVGTKGGVEGKRVRIETPLISMSKGEIIRLGVGLGVDYGLTVSCYDPDREGRACGACDSCRLRRKGFEEAGVSDPTRYVGEG